MTRVFANTDALEPMSDTDGELKANMASHAVIQGCGVTADTADLTVDLAAGAIALDWAYTAVAAQANGWTLVATSTPRLTWLEIDSSGVCQITSGTGAADPVVPELGGNRVPVALVYIPANATLASNCTFLDKRVPLPDTFARYKTTEAQVKNNSTTFLDDDAFFFPIGASETWAVKFKLWLAADALSDFKYEITTPAAPTICTYWTTMAFANPTAGMVSLSTAPATASGSDITVRFDDADDEGVCGVTALIANGTTAGTVQFRWAQADADTVDTFIRIGSFMLAKRIG